MEFLRRVDFADYAGAEWVSGTSYSINDQVRNNGGIFYCTTGHTASGSNEPLAGASWTSVWSPVNRYEQDEALEVEIEGRRYVLLAYESKN